LALGDEKYDQKKLEKTIFPAIKAVRKKILTEEEKEILERGSNGEADALFTIAEAVRSYNSNLAKAIVASTKLPREEFYLQLLTYTAETKDHMLSQAKLGRLYADGVENIIYPSNSKAIYFFQKAAEKGHHQAQFNCGKLMFESDPADIVGSLGFFQTAATFHHDYPDKASAEITKLAVDAHAQISTLIVGKHDFSFREMADVFIFGSSERKLEQVVTELWTNAILILDAIPWNADDDSARPKLIMAHQSLSSIIHGHNENLSNLQLYLAFDTLNDVLKILASMEPSYKEEAEQTALAMDEIRKELGLMQDHHEL